MKKITDYYNTTYVIKNNTKLKYYCIKCYDEIETPRQLCGKYYCKTITRIMNKY
jgi:hypothetical protein